LIQNKNIKTISKLKFTKQKAAEMQGIQFDKYHGLLQIKLAEIQTLALQNTKMSLFIAPEEVSKTLAMVANMPIFRQNNGSVN